LRHVGESTLGGTSQRAWRENLVFLFFGVQIEV